MNAPKTVELIRQRIAEIPLGEPFRPTLFLRYGSRSCVDQSLSRLAKAGTIERIARGVFVRPESNRFVGNVMPDPQKIAEMIAFSTGSVLQLHGAEAARRLELTTQTPVVSVFLTSGPSRRINLGGSVIRLQHVCQRKLALASHPAGLALTAMWYLGRTEVTPALIGKIRHKLSSEEFDMLKSAIGLMPSWMSNAMYDYDRERLREHV
jgi:hypothetical protein